MGSAFALLFEQKIKLPRNFLIYSSAICMLTLLFQAVLTGFIFALESVFCYRKSALANQTSVSVNQPRAMNWMQLYFSKLPFLILAGLVAIFWLKIMGNWDYVLPPIQFDLGSFSNLNWLDFLKMILTVVIMTIIFRMIYDKAVKLMIAHWIVLSIGCGLIMSVMIFLFGPHVSGSGLVFLNPDHGLEVVFWQKWIANLLTISSGISTGLISTSIGIGALISQYFHLEYALGVSAFMAVVLNRPLTGAFLASEFLGLPIFPALFSAVCASTLLFIFVKSTEKEAIIKVLRLVRVSDN